MISRVCCLRQSIIYFQFIIIHTYLKQLMHFSALHICFIHLYVINHSSIYVIFLVCLISHFGLLFVHISFVIWTYLICHLGIIIYRLLCTSYCHILHIPFVIGTYLICHYALLIVIYCAYIIFHL